MVENSFEKLYNLWDKNQKLEDKFNIGNEIEVKIKSFNREEKKLVYNIL